MKIAINGLGRIGRNFIRALVERETALELVAINDLSPIDTSRTLLKYDSILGRFPGTVENDYQNLFINNKAVKYYSERDPENLPWAELGIDLVIDATGVFTTHESASKHLEAGAKRVIITAPATSPDLTVVMGVNEQDYDPEKHFVISNASCTTNCLAPLVKILDSKLKLVEGNMLTVHAYTNDQNLMDSPHKDLRRARAAGLNMIPTSTGAAKAVTEVLPHLAGKLDGSAVRVPVPTGSMISLTARFEYTPTVAEVNALIKEAVSDVVAYTEDPIVSSDIVKDPHSTIFDSTLTKVTNDLVTVTAWYDNEWGYTNRLVDLAEML